MAGPEVPTEPAPADPVPPDESEVTGPSVTGLAADGSAADGPGPATETARRKRTIGERVRATPRFLASIPVTLTTVGLLLLTGILAILWLVGIWAIMAGVVFIFASFFVRKVGNAIVDSPQV